MLSCWYANFKFLCKYEGRPIWRKTLAQSSSITGSTGFWWLGAGDKWGLLSSSTDSLSEMWLEPTELTSSNSQLRMEGSLMLLMADTENHEDSIFFLHYHSLLHHSHSLTSFLSSLGFKIWVRSLFSAECSSYSQAGWQVWVAGWTTAAV